jgi:O-antigen/teichoic acid export membrane protein
LSLKQKTIHGLFWSFVETFGNQGFQFVVGIILARLLLPEDYGIVGLLAIFMGITGVLVDSGFKISIIRSQDLTNVDCSTIFYVNLLVSIICATLLFVLATSIAIFFRKPELINITRAFALIPIINGFGLVQSALIFKNLQFKRNALISLTSNVISGGIAIFLAYQGFSYWSLVWKSILGAGIYNLLLWITSSWHPQFIFSVEILKKHFRFSSKLLLTGMLDSFFDNIYSFIFGKYFSLKELGFFTRGQSFVDIVTKTLSAAIQKVNAPLMAVAGKDNESKIYAYSRLLHITALLIFPAAALLMAVAEPMILFLIGDKWQPAVHFIQILGVAGMIYPVINANSSLFEILGRSDFILKSTLINRPVQIIILLVTIKFSALIVAVGIVVHFMFSFGISFYFVKKVSSQNISELLKVLFLPLSMATFMGLLVYLIGFLMKNNLSNGIIFCIQSIIGIIITISFFYFFKIKEMVFIRTLITDNYNRLKNKILRR